MKLRTESKYFSILVVSERLASFRDELKLDEAA